MGDRTAIEWTDASWSPVTGCSKVSPGCAHCYAEAVSLRFKRSESAWTPANAEANVVLHPERLEQPLRWRRERRIFVCSMADLFHELVPDEFIAQVFEQMAAAGHHTFQVLTKRPERMRDLLDSGQWRKSTGISDWPLPNVWLGTSIENRRYVERADALRQTWAAVRFISAEPLIGPLIADGGSLFSRGPDGQYHQDFADGYQGADLSLTGIDWLIVGGESGRGARPMHDNWVRALRDATREHWRCACGAVYELHELSYLPTQLDRDRYGLRCPSCNTPHSIRARTAFFFKQWGGLRPGGEALLDGREWREFPEINVTDEQPGKKA